LNIVFVGITPSLQTRKHLSSLGFSIHYDPSLLTKQADPRSVFIVCSCNTLDEVRSFSRALSSTDSTLVIFLLDSKLTKSPELAKELSKSSFRFFLLPQDNAEFFLCQNLGVILEHYKLKEQTLELEKQNQLLSQQTLQLSQATSQLVSQFEKDLELAETIQKSLTPQISPSIPGVSLAVKYLPASGLGGDYYDIFELEDKKRFGFLIADSKSHGLAAALLSVLLKLRIEELKDRFPTSSSLVTHLSEEVTKIHKREGTELDLIYGILDRTNLTFQFTSAGPLSPFLWRNSRLISFDTSGAPPLGGKPEYQYHHYDLQLLPGDLLFFNTNGLEAPFRSLGVSLTEGLTRTLSSIKGDDPLLFQNELLAQIGRFKENQSDLPDDITLVQLAVNQKAIYLAQSK